MNLNGILDYNNYYSIMNLCAVFNIFLHECIVILHGYKVNVQGQCSRSFQSNFQGQLGGQCSLQFDISRHSEGLCICSLVGLLCCVSITNCMVTLNAHYSTILGYYWLQMYMPLYLILLFICICHYMSMMSY